MCDVVNHPKQFDGKTVRVKGVVQADFDSFVMRGDSCSSMLWLSYPAGTKAKSGPATDGDDAAGGELGRDAGDGEAGGDARPEQGF